VRKGNFNWFNTGIPGTRCSVNPRCSRIRADSTDCFMTEGWKLRADSWTLTDLWLWMWVAEGDSSDR
jgi:hypothetical protein